MQNEFHKELRCPVMIEGGLAVDDRGELGFVNEFDMQAVRRFYTVCNHRAGLVRAWHAHKQEAKIVTVTAGAAIVAAVSIDDWDNPSKDLSVYRYVLSANRPAVVCLPQGHANGFMTLTEDTKLLFFSTASLEESQGDDFRYDAYYWNPWVIVER